MSNLTVLIAFLYSGSGSARGISFSAYTLSPNLASLLSSISALMRLASSIRASSALFFLTTFWSNSIIYRSLLANDLELLPPKMNKVVSMKSAVCKLRGVGSNPKGFTVDHSS